MNRRKIRRKIIEEEIRLYQKFRRESFNEDPEKLKIITLKELYVI